MEEAVHPGTDSGSGYEPVTVRQFTVFLENRVGRLTALARVICSNSDAAREFLQSQGFSFGEVEVLIVALPKRSQPLLAICTVLLSAEINIHNTYPLLICPGGPAMVIYCDDSILAAQLLMRKGYRMIGQSDFNNPMHGNGNGN
jgi:hypothetical protein